MTMVARVLRRLPYEIHFRLLTLLLLLREIVLEAFLKFRQHLFLNWKSWLRLRIYHLMSWWTHLESLVILGWFIPDLVHLLVLD